MRSWLLSGTDDDYVHFVYPVHDRDIQQLWHSKLTIMIISTVVVYTICHICIHRLCPRDLSTFSIGPDNFSPSVADLACIYPPMVINNIDQFIIAVPSQQADPASEISPISSR